MEKVSNFQRPIWKIQSRYFQEPKQTHLCTLMFLLLVGSRSWRKGCVCMCGCEKPRPLSQLSGDFHSLTEMPQLTSAGNIACFLYSSA